MLPERLRQMQQYRANLYFAYISEGLSNVYYETHDPEVGGLIVRMADFLKNEDLFGGVYNLSDGKYMPFQIAWAWIAEDPNATIRESDREVIWDVYWTNYFASAYQVTGIQNIFLGEKTFQGYHVLL